MSKMVAPPQTSKNGCVFIGPPHYLKMAVWAIGAVIFAMAILLSGVFPLTIFLLLMLEILRDGGTQPPFLGSLFSFVVIALLETAFIGIVGNRVMEIYPFRRISLGPDYLQLGCNLQKTRLLYSKIIGIRLDDIDYEFSKLIIECQGFSKKIILSAADAVACKNLIQARCPDATGTARRPEPFTDSNYRADVKQIEAIGHWQSSNPLIYPHPSGRFWLHVEYSNWCVFGMLCSLAISCSGIACSMYLLCSKNPWGFALLPLSTIVGIYVWGLPIWIMYRIRIERTAGDPIRFVLRGDADCDRLSFLWAANEPFLLVWVSRDVSEQFSIIKIPEVPELPEWNNKSFRTWEIPGTEQKYRVFGEFLKECNDRKLLMQTRH